VRVVIVVVAFTLSHGERLPLPPTSDLFSLLPLLLLLASRDWLLTFDFLCLLRFSFSLVFSRILGPSISFLLGMVGTSGSFFFCEKEKGKGKGKGKRKGGGKQSVIYLSLPSSSLSRSLQSLGSGQSEPTRVRSF
jgi:hypothetical protein